MGSLATRIFVSSFVRREWVVFFEYCGFVWCVSFDGENIYEANDAPCEIGILPSRLMGAAFSVLKIAPIQHFQWNAICESLCDLSVDLFGPT